jgi:hypothetical protein
MRSACCIPKAANTHSEYVILTAFPLQQRFHERASMLYVQLPVLLNLPICFFSSRTSLRLYLRVLCTGLELWNVQPLKIKAKRPAETSETCHCLWFTVYYKTSNGGFRFLFHMLHYVLLRLANADCRWHRLRNLTVFATTVSTWSNVRLGKLMFM